MDIAPIRYRAWLPIASILRLQLRGLGTLPALLLYFCCLGVRGLLSAIFGFGVF